MPLLLKAKSKFLTMMVAEADIQLAPKWPLGTAIIPVAYLAKESMTRRAMEK